MTSPAPRLRRIAAPLLLALAVAGVVAESWGHHHVLGMEGAHEAEVFACASAAHSGAAHVEAARPVTIALCEVCLLRAQTRGSDLLLRTPQILEPDTDARVRAVDHRIASLGLAGPLGSRGPPSQTAVS